jgi:transposase
MQPPFRRCRQLTGDETAGTENADSAAAPNTAILPAGSGSESGVSPRGRPSQCRSYRDLIQAKLDQQLSAQRIRQDLVAEHGFTGCYDSVKRYVRRLSAKSRLAFRRLECAAGEETQVDFGTGAPVIAADGKWRRTYVFRIVLSHSRKGYSEATFTQTTDDFLVQAFWRHYGTVILPTKPYMPRRNPKSSE